jgi:hypothetical protein
MYIPENREKYRGDVSNIICRSSWERALCKFFDSSSEIESWSSEEIVIPYISPLDGKTHRYYTDFLIKLKSGKQILIEVKPENETAPPKSKRKASRERWETWHRNQAKWKAAKTFADKNGIEFQIWTEKTLDKLGVTTMKPVQRLKKPPLHRRKKRRLKS